MKFRYVDQILDWTPYERIRGVKAVSFEEYCLKEAFSGEAGLPESLLLESVLQLGNWLILLSTDFKQMGMVIRMSRIHFHDFLRPGERMEMEARIVRQNSEGFELAGKGCVGDREIITGLGCLAAPVDAEELVNPADMRVLFAEIYQPESK
jgi:3-hydroxymyristoyl/3-hydroxydecanoyl-(acyl carrier protein) dehydratase